VYPREGSRAMECGRWSVNGEKPKTAPLNPKGAAPGKGNNILDSRYGGVVSWLGMALTTRAYSKGRINRAGKEVLSPTIDSNSPEFSVALDVIANWRSCHAYPLQVVRNTLNRRALTLDPHVLIGQREKRLVSIYLKLSDNPTMKLTTMQDLGGCRAVVKSVKEVEDLVRIYKKNKSKNIQDRPIWDDHSDYIANPKPDGYRSFHIIMKYGSKYPSRAIFNGQKIEIQIRSRLQHAWATAVEIVQTFTGDVLKTRKKSMGSFWLRFFTLMSNAIAYREKCPLVPGISTNRIEWIKELREMAVKHRVIGCLEGWTNAMNRAATSPSDEAHAYVVTLDPVQNIVDVQSFKKNEILKAQEKVSSIEKSIGVGTNEALQVVLIYANSLEDLRRAYPNLYVDTNLFVEAIKREI
jgi:hypothetical protein